MVGSTKQPFRRPPPQHFPALLADAIQPSHHVVDGVAIDQRTHQRGRIARIADADLLVGGQQTFRDAGAMPLCKNNRRSEVQR